MRLLRVLLTLVSLSLPLAGCDLLGGSDDEAAPSAFGLDSATRLTYRWTWTELDADGNEMVSEQHDYVIFVTDTDVRLDSLKNLIHVEVFAAPDDTARQEIWYQETETELLEVAYRNAGAVPLIAPKRQTGALFGYLLPGFPPSYAGKTTSSDSIYVRSKPRVVYRLPLAEQEAWVSFNDPFLHVRDVVGTEEVTVPAGTFTAAKVRSRIPTMDPSWTAYDYVTKDGLVLREMKSAHERRDAENRPIGTLTTHERVELLSREVLLPQ